MSVTAEGDGPAKGPATQQLQSGQAPPTAGLRDLLLDRSYVALCLMILVLTTSFTLRQQWGVGTDIWEHAAASRQLGADPVDPGHPLFSVDRPHQFYSPYALALGVTSRITGLSIVTVLSWAGVVNLLLLMTGLWLFMTRLVKRRNVAFWTLLFVLFLWGPGAWNWSGFFHFKVLPFVLPYPATFATTLMLFALWAYLLFLDTQNPLLLVAVPVVFWAVLLTHPIDAITLAVGVGALTIAGPRERLWTNLLLSGATLTLGVLAALPWPYFSVFDLLFGASNEGYRDAAASLEHVVYTSVLGRAWPMLLVVPFVLRRVFADRRDALAVWLLGLLLAYGYGWASHNWSYGRLISAVMLVGAMILADERVKAGMVAAALRDLGRPALPWVQVSTVALLAVGVFYTRNGFTILPQRVLNALPPGWVQSEFGLVELSQYSFLPHFVGDGQVVLADGFTNLEVPAFGGKVVAVPRPEAFVDTLQSGSDLSRFFDEGTAEGDRRAIISRYNASYLLLENAAVAADPDGYRPLLKLGGVAYRNERFILLDVRGGRESVS